MSVSVNIANKHFLIPCTIYILLKLTRTEHLGSWDLDGVRETRIISCVSAGV